MDNNFDIDIYINDLSDNGYTIIPNVFNKEEIEEYRSEFDKWMIDVPDLAEIHNLIDSNGIFKYHQVGHQRFAWLARSNPKVLDIFKKLWNTDELVTSFDGCCFYPKDYVGEQNYWTHTDQGPHKFGLYCYQSFLSLTDNLERTLVVYRGSHLLHQHYFKYMNIYEEKDWQIIDKEYIKYLEDTKEILEVKAGDLVIWDSRTFHQNTSGFPSTEEERLVQYLCYLPKNKPGNNDIQQRLRKKYFDNKRTTSHWVYPMNVVPLQPVLYNYYNPEMEIYIDYDLLPVPYIDDLLPVINNLL